MVDEQEFASMDAEDMYRRYEQESDDIEEEAEELLENYADCVYEIINRRQQLERFLKENPGHTMKAEVNIEIREKIQILRDEAETTLALIGAIQNG